MKGYCYQDDMTEKEQKDGAYWERNMLALAIAAEYYDRKKHEGSPMGYSNIHGWYIDKDNNWSGWKRVISLWNGKMCFHIPDDFEVGNLPEIEPNWDGHTTRDKWDGVAHSMGFKLEWN